MHAFRKFGLFDILLLNKDKFIAFIEQIERKYCIDPTIPNSYHNSMHAADVVHASAYFAVNPHVSKCLNVIHLLSLLFAAAIHDFRHPGVSNKYLRNSRNLISLMHNDDSALERFHLAEAFTLLVTEDLNFFDPPADVPPEDKHKVVPWDEMRDTVIQAVFATDLAHGPAYSSKFRLKMDTGFANDQVLLIQMLLKAADIGHPTKTFEVHNKWTNLIMEEFFNQGDAERESGMIVSPLCDRVKDINVPNNQKGFIDFVVRPVYEPLYTFLKDEVYLTNLKANYLTWQTKINEVMGVKSIGSIGSKVDSPAPSNNIVQLGKPRGESVTDLSEAPSEAASEASAGGTIRRRTSMLVMNPHSILSGPAIAGPPPSGTAATTLNKKLSNANIVFRGGAQAVVKAATLQFDDDVKEIDESDDDEKEKE
jgi:hypothetical protein